MNDELFKYISENQFIWGIAFKRNQKMYRLNKNRAEKKRTKERNKIARRKNALKKIRLYLLSWNKAVLDGTQ
jgi:hypothetical protein